MLSEPLVYFLSYLFFIQNRKNYINQSTLFQTHEINTQSYTNNYTYTNNSTLMLYVMILYILFVPVFWLFSVFVLSISSLSLLLVN